MNLLLLLCDIIPDYQAEQTKIFFWTMIISFVTSFFLIINLVLQRKANILSNKKFLYDIRPEFILIIKPTAPVVGINNNIFLRYEVKLTKNVALDFKINNTGAIKQIALDQRRLEYIQVNQVFPLLQEYFPIEIITQHYCSELLFTDEVGTKYKQILKGDPRDLQLSPPLKIG